MRTGIRIDSPKVRIRSLFLSRYNIIVVVLMVQLNSCPHNNDGTDLITATDRLAAGDFPQHVIAVATFRSQGRNAIESAHSFRYVPPTTVDFHRETSDNRVRRSVQETGRVLVILRVDYHSSFVSQCLDKITKLYSRHLQFDLFRFCSFHFTIIMVIIDLRYKQIF